MKDKITELLTSLNIEGLDAKDLTDKIAKEVALHTVPKEKYNDLSDKFKNESVSRSSAEEELENLKTAATELDTKNAEIKKLEKLIKEQGETIKSQIMKSNKAQAKSILKDAGVADKDMDGLLENIVTDDEEKTIALANSFANVLKVNVSNAKEIAESEDLKKMGNPNIKNDNEGKKAITKDDFNKMTFAEKKELYFKDKDLYDKLVD